MSKREILLFEAIASNNKIHIIVTKFFWLQNILYEEKYYGKDFKNR